MNTADLARILRENYLRPPSGKQTVEIHLFGIRYADALKMHSIAEVVERAGLPKVMSTKSARAGHSRHPCVYWMHSAA